VKPSDPHSEPQLLALYLPGRLLDEAEGLAMRSGSANVQEYCADLLSAAIQAESRHLQDEATEVRNNPLESLDALASDPDYLAEWNASAREHADETIRLVPPPEASDDPASARAIVFRHAGIGIEDSSGLLPTLRRGEAIRAGGVTDLLGALIDLEGRLREAQSLDRPLAYALHRLAFEGQVLLTDAPTEAASDPATVDALRRVQEAVDRILSGEDIRYDLEPRPSDAPR
jgi:hypothetical protein